MPERFEDLLSDAAETAASATGVPGAAAARARGGQRRNRRRLAATTLSLALLGSAGGVAAALSGGPAHKPATTLAATTAHGTPGGKSSPSQTATNPSPVTSAPSSTSSTSSSPTGSTGNTSPGGTQLTTSSVPSPNSYVAGGWLSATSLPFGSGYHGTWSPASIDGTHLGGTVYLQSTPAEFCSEEMAGEDMSHLAADASGQQLEEFSSQGITIAGQAIAGSTAQQTLFFPSTAAAQRAWNTLSPDFAACKAQMTGNDPTTGQNLTGWTQQTLDQGDAQCWSSLTTFTAAQSTSGGDLTHFCFVRSGSLITAVNVDVHSDGAFGTVDFGTQDSNTVTALRQALSAYGSGG